MNYIHRLTYKCLFCNIMCCIYVTLQIQVMARKDFRVILYLYKNIRGVQHLCNFTANTQRMPSIRESHEILPQSPNVQN